MAGRGKDEEWILGGSGEERRHGRKRKGWKVYIGGIWRGAEAWKEEERMEYGYREDLWSLWTSWTPCGSQETSSSVGLATDCSRGSRGSLEEGTLSRPSH